MRAQLIPSLGLRTLLVGAAVLAVATAANARPIAGTLSVYTTDILNNLRSTFEVGETILLKVDGDTGSDPVILQETSIVGYLAYNGTITDTLGVTQGIWLTNIGELIFAEGYARVFNQTGPVTNPGVSTSVVTLVATAVGTSSVMWAGSLIDFFGIYASSGPCCDIPPGHSFTIVPEPDTLALIGLGLLGLAGWRRPLPPKILLRKFASPPIHR